MNGANNRHHSHTRCESQASPMQLWMDVFTETKGLERDMVQNLRSVEYHKWYIGIPMTYFTPLAMQPLKRYSSAMAVLSQSEIISQVP